MITRISINALRGIRSGALQDLSKLSILVGPNNSGKSTCLEAIAILGQGSMAREIALTLMRRGGPARDALDHIISAGDQVARMEGLVGEPEDPGAYVELRVLEKNFLQVIHYRAGNKYRASVKITGDGSVGGTVIEKNPDGKAGPLFPVRLVDVAAVSRQGALEDAYTSLENARQLPFVIQALQPSAAGLMDFRILKVEDHFTLHAVQAKGKPVPAFLYGDGFKRFLEIAAATIGDRPDVTLLEEPESFQHPRYLRELANLLHAAARREGAQVILSTHSIELIDYLLDMAAERDYPTVHRLRLVEGTLVATTLSPQAAQLARTELLEDLRR